MSGVKSERFTFRVNGTEHTLEADGKTPLLDVLRNTLGLKGTRFGCGTEQCGACMVLIDGKPVYSCAREVATVAGKTVTTVEGLPSNGALLRPHYSQVNVANASAVTFSGGQSSPVWIRSFSSIAIGDITAKGGSTTITFTQPGNYYYICLPHPWMYGQVVVE